MQYVSPGDAFSSSLEQSLLVRAQAERQAQMDQLAMQREQRQVRHDAEERAQAQAALAEKRREFNETQTDKQKAAFEKTLGTMVPGDIPSPEIVEQAKKFGLSHLFPEFEPQMAAAPPQAAPPMMPEPPAAIAAEGAPIPMPEPMLPDAAPKPEMAPPAGGGMRFLGSPKQREEAEAKKQALQIIDAMPDGPQKQALMLSVKMGKLPTADMFKGPDSDVVPTYRSDPKRNVVERLVNGKWVPESGDTKKGAHWLQEPTPSAPQSTTLTPTSEAALIAKLNKRWTEATKPARELDRQIGLIDAGMVAARRGDLSQGAQTVLVAFQKILDPPSVVRESEFDRSAKGQSLLNRVAGAYERLTKGGAGVTLEELEKFHTLAKEASAAQRSHYMAAERSRIGRNADRYKLPHELIFEDESPAETGPSTPDSTAAPAAPQDAPKQVRYDRNGKRVQ